MVYSAAAEASLSGMGGNFTLKGQWQNNIGIIFSLSTSLGNWWLHVDSAALHTRKSPKYGGFIIYKNEHLRSWIAHDNNAKWVVK